MESHNIMNNEEMLNHPLMRLLMQNIQISRDGLGPGPGPNDILQTTFDEQEIKSKSTCNEFIDKLQEISISEEDIEKKLSCSICQDEFELNEKIIELPCSPNKHHFHAKNEKCGGILTWLRENNTCPMCRFEFPEEGELDLGNDNDAEDNNNDAEDNNNDDAAVDNNNDAVANAIANAISNVIADVDAVVDAAEDNNNAEDDSENDNEVNQNEAELIIINAIMSRLQNMPINPDANVFPIQMDTVRDGFSDRDIDEALRRSLV